MPLIYDIIQSSWNNIRMLNWYNLPSKFYENIVNNLLLNFNLTIKFQLENRLILQ